MVVAPSWRGESLFLRLLDGLARTKASRAADAADVAGVVLTSLITVPNWPFFNRHPLHWLDPIEAEKHPKPQPAISGPKKKASKK
ncbi:hypothetical protein DH2020_009094 [Rehmannia glutinosa]|uniref:Signal peptidase complex subunit 1 n=1 Tax=Rehmannia glutinosa TaxID=99300 RepID=A0ABR0X7V3_REHGL